MRQGRTGVSYKGESKTGRGGRGRGRGAVSKASESQRGGELGLRLAICRVQGYEAQDEGRATESVVVRGCGTRQGAAALVTRGAAEMVAGRREKREDGEKKETVKRKEEEGEEEKREMVALLVSQQFVCRGTMPSLTMTPRSLLSPTVPCPTYREDKENRENKNCQTRKKIIRLHVLSSSRLSRGVYNNATCRRARRKV